MIDSKSPEYRLRLSGFEELMLDQESQQHACVICVRVTLSGQLDSQRLERALRHVVHRHPLLRAKVEVSWGKLWWRIEPLNDVRLNIHAQPAPLWPKQTHFDLRQSFGIQADLYPSSPTCPARQDAAETPTSATLFLQLHHSAVDGLGSVQLVEELLLEYGQPGNGAQSCSASDLRARNQFGLTIVKLLQLVPLQLRGLAGVRQYLMRKPITLSPRQASRSVQDHVTAVEHRFSVDESQQLKQTAKEHRATLNDWLACLIFEALDQYRRMQTAYRSSDWLRAMVPMSLRNLDESRKLVCNVVSCVFLDRTGSQIGDSDALLKSIHEEMELIKQNRLALLFILSLWLKKVLRWRSGQRAALGTPLKRCQTSFVFSNLGKLFQGTKAGTTSDGRLCVDNLVADTCDLLAPVAPLMSVAITTYQYAGRISICLRYDAAIFTVEEAQKLLMLIIERCYCAQRETARA